MVKQFVEKRLIRRVFNVYRDVQRKFPTMDERETLLMTAATCLHHLQGANRENVLNSYFRKNEDLDLKFVAGMILQFSMPLQYLRETDYAESDRRFELVKELYEREFSL